MKSKRKLTGSRPEAAVALHVAPPRERVTMSRSEGRDLRESLDDRARRLGHALKPWKEYVSCDGKWTTSCRKCGSIAIMYETTPIVGDEVTGNALTRECPKEGDR